MNLLFWADPHLSPRPPISRKDDYAKSILQKIQYVAELAHLHSAETVMLGDLFHHRDPARTPFWLFTELAYVLQAFPFPPYVVVGNHDCQPSGLRSLMSSPLGGLIQANLLQRCWGFFADDWVIHFLDYPFKQEDYLNVPKADKNFMVRIACTHWNLDTLDDTGLMGQEVLFASGYNLIINGHEHRKEVLKRENGIIIKVPALSRRSIVTAQQEVPPEVLLLETTDYSYTWLPIPHAPGEDVFRFEEHFDKKERSVRMEEFLQGVSSLRFSGADIHSYVDELAPSLPPNVLRRTVEYLTHAMGRF